MLVKIGERKWRKVLDYGGLIWYNTLMDKREEKYKEILRLKDLLAERGFEKSLLRIKLLLTRRSGKFFDKA